MPLRLSLLRASYLLVFAALGVYLPFFPRWLEARGVHGIAMGAIAATLPAMGVLGPPVFGVAADWLRLRGALLRLCCAGASAGFLGLALLSSTSAVIPFVALLAVTIVIALFRSPIVMLIDVLTLSHVAAAGTTYPRVRLWGSLGFLVAAIAAGRLLDPTEAVAFPLVIGACLFGATIVTFALPSRDLTIERPSLASMRTLVKSRDFQLFLLASFLGQAGHSAYDLCFSLHLRDLGFREDLVGVAWATGVVAEVLLMATIAARPKRGAPGLLAAAFAGAAVRWLLVASIESRALLLLIQPLHAISFGLMWVSSLAYAKDRIDAPLLATSQGLFLAAVGAGSVCGMLAWGPLYEAKGGSVTFAAASLLSMLAALVALLFRRETLRARPARA